jgi:hypothetical protein
MEIKKLFKKTWVKVTAAGLGLTIISLSIGKVLGSKNERIRSLENENMNLRDLCRGEEETIRKLNYGLGKKMSSVGHQVY